MARPLFTPGKWPPVPIKTEAGWGPRPVWTQRLEETPSAYASIWDRTPVRSQTLYWLSYRGSKNTYKLTAIRKIAVLPTFREYCSCVSMELVSGLNAREWWVSQSLNIQIFKLCGYLRRWNMMPSYSRFAEHNYSIYLLFIQWLYSIEWEDDSE
jgi:hypothetical protein